MDAPEHDLLRTTADRLAVQDAITSVFVCADRRDWTALRAVLGENIALDYTSLNGGEPAEISADDLLAAWRGTLGGFTATQHLLGSFLVQVTGPDVASATFSAIATHVLDAGAGDRTWTVAGHYDAQLRKDDGWRLSALTLHLDWAAGNENLMTLASETRSR